MRGSLRGELGKTYLLKVKAVKGRKGAKYVIAYMLNTDLVGYHLGYIHKFVQVQRYSMSTVWHTQ